MATTAADELEQHTRMYWDVSMAWNGIIPGNITVEDALNCTGESLRHLDPNRPLANRIRQLRHDIITYDNEAAEISEVMHHV
jgi:hypothetical protein